MTLLELLNIETGASMETLQRVIATAPRRYKVYEIPKKTGGTRTIAHPARELKSLQRVILHGILDKIAVSDIATAYIRGRGIAYNARSHSGSKWILKLDFHDFFHSITPRDWDRIVRRTETLAPFSRESADFHNLLFWGRGGREPACLSIGAPTSPSVSNLACARLDEWMARRATRLGLRVTRYADDITVSGDEVKKIRKFESDLTAFLDRNNGPNLTLNPAKRGLYGPGERKMVTGIILTPEGKISIGRERKREISALIHKFSVGNLDQATAFRAKGLLAFSYSVEPDFFESMKTKYGDNLIEHLLRLEKQGDVFDLDIEF